MNRNEFYNGIRVNLRKFSSSEVDKIIEYYDELISEKMESGMSEEEAVNSFGDIRNIVNVVTADLVMERSKNEKNNSLRNFFIILGICASPILLPIGIAFFAIFLSFIIVFFSLVVAFSASAIGILISIFPLSFEMYRAGNDMGLIILGAGGLLLASGICVLLTVATLQVGKYFMIFLNKSLSKLIKKKTKGENIWNF